MSKLHLVVTHVILKIKNSKKATQTQLTNHHETMNWFSIAVLTRDKPRNIS